MSDTDPTPTNPEAVNTPSDVAPGDTSDATEAAAPSDEEVAKWKAMARKHEAQAKANADAAKRLKELEDAGKSEQEKLTQRLTDAETRATKAEAQLMRLEVAAVKGLTPAQAKRLVGDTREELEADADDLLASFTAPTQEVDPTSRPKERLRPGSVPDAEPVEMDPRKLAERVRRQ